MQLSFLPIRAFVAICLCLCATSIAQEQAQSSASTNSYTFDQLTQRAGIIFSGIVTAVEIQDSVVRVNFHVDDGLRGAHTGDELVLLEWTSGRTGTAVRYHVGERILAFYHPTSENGLTSPVGGSAGVIRYGSGDFLRFNEAQSQSISRAPRLAAALGDAQTAQRTRPAGEFLRALRLVLDTGRENQ